jgi:hypothetical protein
MNQDPSKDLTLIVYNTPNPPQYLKINKGLIKTLFILIPFMVITSITFSFIYSIVLKNKIVSLKSEVPKEIVDLKNKNLALSKSLITFRNTNKSLIQKLSKGGGTETSLSSMGLFTIPLGLKDLRNRQLVQIKDVKIESGSTIKLNFNLENSSPGGEKLSGYISVIQYQGSMIQFYPAYELPQRDLRLEYTQGESFGFSRFRPTVVEFKKINKSSTKYKIFIFSRTGDLIAFKQLGPYNID